MDTTSTAAWSPRWARVLAQVALAVVVAAAAFLAWVISDDLSYNGDKFDGLLAALAGLGLGALVVVAAPWTWFLWRGGKVAFGMGSVLLAGALLVSAVLALA